MGRVWYGAVCSGVAGMVGRGTFRLGRARLGRHGMARCSKARSGVAWLDKVE
jgi:hypothetical protein